MKKAIILPWLSLLLLLWPFVSIAQNGERPVLVQVATASLQMLAPISVLPGTVVSRSDARLSAEVEGRLIEVAEVGTTVGNGDAIAKIEDTLLKLRRDEQAAEVARARARLKYLESEERRFVQLAESNLAAVTKLEQTRSDRDVSRGDLRVAQSRFAQIEDQLARTTIVAPFSGIVVERLMMPGERVTTGTEVVRIVDQHHLEVIVRAPLEYFTFVNPGQVLELQAGAATATGVVRTVVAVGSENTHQFELRLDIEGNRFPIGQTLRVGVPTSTERQVLVVPRDALVLRPGSISVFVIDADKKARKVSVTTGIGAGEKIEVFGEINDGDSVVVRGNERLQTGQTVSVSGG